MKIALGSDHAGYRYKEIVKTLLEQLRHEVIDFGAYSDASCDYPDFIRPAAEAYANGEVERGIVFGAMGKRCGKQSKRSSLQPLLKHKHGKVRAFAQ